MSWKFCLSLLFVIRRLDSFGFVFLLHSYKLIENCMTTYIIRRIMQAVFILILVTIIVFLAMRMLPGDPIYMIMSEGQISNTTAEEIEYLRHQFGLDKPFIVQYVDWITGVFHGNFGKSIVHQRSPLSIISMAIPKTLNISLPAFFISLIIGIPAGVICAIRRGTWIDTVVTVIANIGITIPIFWLGTMLIYLFAIQLGWLPVHGYTSPFVDLGKNIRQLIMPVFCLGIFPISATARQARSSMLEVMSQDYIRTAWSKGLEERVVVLRHALKNGLIPVVTLLGISFSYIIGGSVLIETVFNIRGVGQTLVSAVFSQDYPVVQGYIFFIAITVLLINLIVDISYGWLDPRIRYN
jgi:peptide/nickel transport system permease protein